MKLVSKVERMGKKKRLYLLLLLHLFLFSDKVEGSWWRCSWKDLQ